MVNNLAVTLICVNEDVVLAVVQVSTIKMSGRPIQDIPVTMLQEPNVEIGCQILGLQLRKPSTADPSDWTCNTSPLELGVRSSLIPVIGNLMEVISPIAVLPSNGQPVFHF
jgi:hypothetical protein